MKVLMLLSPEWSKSSEDKQLQYPLCWLMSRTTFKKKRKPARRWTPEEEAKLVELHERYGSDWSAISKGRRCCPPILRNGRSQRSSMQTEVGALAGSVAEEGRVFAFRRPSVVCLCILRPQPRLANHCKIHSRTYGEAVQRTVRLLEEAFHILMVHRVSLCLL